MEPTTSKKIMKNNQKWNLRSKNKLEDNALECQIHKNKKIKFICSLRNCY